MDKKHLQKQLEDLENLKNKLDVEHKKFEIEELEIQIKTLKGLIAKLDSNGEIKQTPKETIVLPESKDKNRPIEERIQEFIAPMREFIQNDGGDVLFKSFDKQTKILTLQIAGHCIGCASYDQTYTYGIRDYLLNNFKDEINDVIFETKTN